MNTRLLSLLACISLSLIPNAVSAHCGTCGVGDEAHEGHEDHKEEAKADPLAVPEGAKVSFVAPADGATVQSPVKVTMGIEGMTVKPAGALEANTGHHHIIVDDAGVTKGTAVPADATHIHFGAGQTETELKLAPGKHTLTLQFADGLHRSYGPGMSTTITVTVSE
jgi:hypothetical protein